MILGIDEVGRGAWAGPLVVGAVVLGNVEIEGLADSKQLSSKKREMLSDIIMTKASAVGLGWVHASEIDEIGLSEALRIATRRAVENINVSYHEIIIDGNINFLEGTTKGKFVTTLKKADQLIPSVSAASIVAKVARDKYMHQQETSFPGYGFKRNVGYGTKLHSEGISSNGIVDLHRRSFKPIKDNLITTKNIGDRGESIVSEYLTKIGHKILERNWKTNYCEIDIVSRYRNKIYFTEVKYRRNNIWGTGLEVITKQKLKKMLFAANIYMTNYEEKLDFEVAAASVSGQPMKLDEWLEVF